VQGGDIDDMSDEQIKKNRVVVKKVGKWRRGRQLGCSRQPGDGRLGGQGG
jgi:hypothetical protein